MNAAGALPAESGSYKVEVPRIMVAQGASGKETSLTFTFVISVQQRWRPTHIIIEDVSDDGAVIRIDDKDPKLVQNQWKRFAAPLKVSDRLTPWIFDGKPLTRVFKVTISSKDAPDLILYQLAWYPAQAKGQIADLVKKNG